MYQFDIHICFNVDIFSKKQNKTKQKGNFYST